MSKLAAVALCALLSVCVAVDKHHGQNLRKGVEDTDHAEKGMVATMNAAKHGSDGPAVIDRNFCAFILVQIEKKQAPYWDSESGDGEGCCNEDRPELLAQCAQKLKGFMDSVSSMCPSIDPPAPGDDFKKVQYVGDILTDVTASQHKKPPVPIKDDCEDCGEDEVEETEPLKRTTKVGADGKAAPDKAFSAAPLAPSAEASHKLEDAECDSPPCTLDYKKMAPPPCVSEDGRCPPEEKETEEGE